MAGRDHKVSADGGGSLEEGVGVGWVGGAESKEAFVVAGDHETLAHQLCVQGPTSPLIRLA